MNSKEHYCFATDICDRVENESAPMTSRGTFGGAWERPDRHKISINITSHGKEHKPFVGCNV